MKYLIIQSKFVPSINMLSITFNRFHIYIMKYNVTIFICVNFWIWSKYLMNFYEDFYFSYFILIHLNIFLKNFI